MEPNPGKSGVRLCQICQKLHSQNEFAGKACKQCWKWFKQNADHHLHNPKNLVCLLKCEDSGANLCNSCQITKFLRTTNYRISFKQCFHCGKQTVLNHRRPKCSDCHQLSRDSKMHQAVSKNCSCSDSSSVCLCAASGKTNSSLTTEKKLSNISSNLNSLSEACTSPMVSEANELESNHQEPCLRINLTAVPKDKRKDVQNQLRKECSVRIKRLALESSYALYSAQDVDHLTCKRPKGGKNTSIKTSPVDKHPTGGESRPKSKPSSTSFISPENSTYSVVQVSETRLVLHKPPEKCLVAKQSPVNIYNGYLSPSPVPLVIDDEAQSPISQLSADTSSSSISKNVVEDEIESDDKSGRQDQLQSEKIRINFKVPRQACCDKATQTGNSKEDLELQIKELQRMVASMSSSPESVLSKPLFSDEILSGSETNSTTPVKNSNNNNTTLNNNHLRISNSKSTNECANTSGSVRTSGTPKKSPTVVITRLTKDDLRLHGVSEDTSSTPVDRNPTKKGSHLISSDPSSSSERMPTSKDVTNSCKQVRKQLNGSIKSKLFGDDSDDSDTPITVKARSDPLLLDDNELDFEEDDPVNGNLSSSTSESVETSKYHQQLQNGSKESSAKLSKIERRDRSLTKKKHKDKESSESRKSLKSKERSKSENNKKSKEKSHKEKKDDKSENSSKWRIPKLANPPAPHLNDAPTVGLPDILQKNLEEAQKGPQLRQVAQVNGTAPIGSIASSQNNQENTQKIVSIFSIEDIPSSTSKQDHSDVQQDTIANGKVPSPTPLSRKRRYSLLEESTSPGVNKSSSTPTPILCLIPSKKDQPKSVVFSENLVSVRTISPRSPTNRAPTSNQKIPAPLINGVIEDLVYDPASSRRKPSPFVPGIRPYHPPVRKIQTETRIRSPSPTRKRKRFVDSGTSTDSSEEDSADEAANTQVSLSDSCRTSHDDDENVKRNALESSEETDVDTDESAERALAPDNQIRSAEKPTTSDSSPPKRSSEAVTVPSTGFAKNTQEDSEEEEDILDIFLDCDALGLEYVEEEKPKEEIPRSTTSKEPSTSKIMLPPSSTLPNDSQNHIPNQVVQPAYTPMRTPVAIPEVPLETRKGPNILPAYRPAPSALQAKAITPIPASMTGPQAIAPGLSYSNHQDHERICHDYIRGIKCQGSTKPNAVCPFSHTNDIRVVIGHIRRLHSKNAVQARNLVVSMTKEESPMNRYLFSEEGKQLIEIIIGCESDRSLDLNSALHILASPKYPFVGELVVPTIHKLSRNFASKLAGDELKKLYDRCKLEGFRIPPRTWDIIIDLYLRLSDPISVFDAVEAALLSDQSYQVPIAAIDLLFEKTHAAKFVQVCEMFINQRALNRFLYPRQEEIIQKIRNHCTHAMYDAYLKIFKSSNQLMEVAIPPPHNQQPFLVQHPQSQLNARVIQPQHPSSNWQRPPLISVATHPMRFPPPMSSARMPPTPHSLHSYMPTPRVPSTLNVRFPAQNGTSSSMGNGVIHSSVGPLLPLKSIASVHQPPAPIESRQPRIAQLQVPKPTQSLDVNLFAQPTETSKELCLAESEPTSGPSVVVEPSYGTENDLLTEFSRQKFENVTKLCYRYYSGNPKCPMLNNLVMLMTTHPLFDSENNNEQMSIVVITIRILASALQNGDPSTLENRNLKALIDLIYLVICQLWNKSMGNEEDQESSKNDMVVLLQALNAFQLPLEQKIQHPSLLLFIADCYLWCCTEYDNAEEEEFDESALGEIMNCINLSFVFLTEFHSVVAKLSVGEELIHKEFEISGALFNLLKKYQPLCSGPNLESLANGIEGALSDYQTAGIANRSHFEAILGKEMQ